MVGNLGGSLLISIDIIDSQDRCGRNVRVGESVAKRAVDAARDYLASEAVVGSHLADQLLLPTALAGGGEFTTMPVTQHFESHVEIIRKFLSRRVVTDNSGNSVGVRVG